MKTEVIPSSNTLQQVHDDLFIPLTYALMQVQRNGFSIDQAKLTKMQFLYDDKIDGIENNIRSFPEVLRIEQEVGKKFNVDSCDQIRDLFFNKLGLPTDGVEKTDGGAWSTNKYTIEKLKDNHEIVNMLHQHRIYGTLRKMYVKPMWRHICADGKVHCMYNINGTVTGRLSCEAPNLQQIPKNIKPAKIGFDFDPSLNIKHLFVSSGKDYVILQADYSQMELRILAEYSQDQSMIHAFKMGEDIHQRTGAEMAGHSIDKDSYWRDAAKTINFGIIYGKTVRTLAADLNIPEKQAAAFLRSYFERMPMVENYLEGIKKFCYANKYVTSMFGRIRRLKGVESTDKYVVFETLRKATNMGIQSTAADYTHCSIINISDMFNQYNMKSRVIATVHDNILFDVYKPELRTVAEIVYTIMVNPINPLIYWNMDVPLVADLEVGDEWAKLEPYKLN